MDIFLAFVFFVTDFAIAMGWHVSEVSFELFELFGILKDILRNILFSFGWMGVCSVGGTKKADEAFFWACWEGGREVQFLAQIVCDHLYMPCRVYP